MHKIWTTETWQRLNDMLLKIGVEDGVVPGVRDIDGIDANILSSYDYARPGTIVGGASEVQCNLLARYSIAAAGKPKNVFAATSRILSVLTAFDATVLLYCIYNNYMDKDPHKGRP